MITKKKFIIYLLNCLKTLMMALIMADYIKLQKNNDYHKNILFHYNNL